MTVRLVSRNGTDALAVSMADMAMHLKREDTVEDDDYINGCLLAAIDEAERFTGQVMIDSTYDFFADDFPIGVGPIYLGRAPLLEIVSVTYRDVGAGSTVLDPAAYGINTADSAIYLPAASNWPDTDGAAHAVAIRFRAGYVDYDTYPPSVGDIPPLLKQSIMIIAANFYGNRDNEQLSTPTRIPWGAEWHLRHFKIDDSLA
jgi:uncharacterized phiE125 gp8 family phage protein